MTEDQGLALPRTGYDVMAKVLKAYSLTGDEAIGREEIANKAGLSGGQVSHTHSFLTSIGILTGGQQKALTEEGKELARAIQYGFEEEEWNHWRDIILTSDAMQDILDTVRVQQPLADDELPKRIASTLEVPYEGYHKTGINTLVTIMENAGILREKDEGYGLVSEPEGETESGSDVSTGSEDVQTRDGSQTQSHGSRGVPEVHIDIQVHISSDADAEQIDQIFSSMAEHLYGQEE